ncbi:MAG: sulfite exporter TauE/SafE family protein [Cyclobacteriaceae bacterium]|jgi:hypothetical protein|nr:sulfite exporter TauE/SafE family protein [Cyclobacteriaceae bacterium]
MASFSLLVIAFFLIALVYATVGFGGGSSYLALLALPVFALSPDVIRPTALFCNLVVVGGSLWVFHRQRLLNWKAFWPFLVLSVPAAYVGGLWRLRDQVFFVVLGITLLAAAAALWIQPTGRTRARINAPVLNVVMGAAIGFLSGLVGIGGGIFLSPLLLLLRWAEPRHIAALASVFIFVNSVAGMLGQWQRGLPAIDPRFLGPLLLAVLAGGQVGARLGTRAFEATHIKRVTAVLIGVAALIILVDVR